MQVVYPKTTDINLDWTSLSGVSIHGVTSADNGHYDLDELISKLLSLHGKVD